MLKNRARKPSVTNPRKAGARKRPRGTPKCAGLSPAKALDLAVAEHKRTVVRWQGRPVAVVPVRDLRLLERLIEQKEDRADVKEAERRLSDPAEIPIPYDQVRRQLGF